MRESALWGKLKAARIFDWAERIESATTPGIPDVHGLIKGQELWVELKVAPVKLRPAQVLWHQRWHSLGQRNGFILARGPTHLLLWPSRLAGSTQAAMGPPSWANPPTGTWPTALRDALWAMCLNGS